MRISEVARQTGLSPSALRYYEREQLLPRPPRVGRQRAYGAEVIGRIRIIRLAREAGLSIAETRTLVNDYGSDSRPSARWRAMAERKAHELDAAIEKALRMKALLESSFHCHCATIADCERIFASRDAKPPTHRFRA